MFEVFGFDARDGLSVVDDFGPRFDKSVEDYVSVEVDDRNAREPVSFLSENALTVDREDFRLPMKPCQNW